MVAGRVDIRTVSLTCRRVTTNLNYSSRLTTTGTGTKWPRTGVLSSTANAGAPWWRCDETLGWIIRDWPPSDDLLLQFQSQPETSGGKYYSFRDTNSIHLLVMPVGTIKRQGTTSLDACPGEKKMMVEKWDDVTHVQPTLQHFVFYFFLSVFSVV